MDLYEALRTTSAIREFATEAAPDSALHAIIEQARFAPSGGNRQGARVIIVREASTKQAIAELAVPAAKRYRAQQQRGENPWNTIDETTADAEAIEATPAPPGLTMQYTAAPVLLVVCVDLKVVASVDRYLGRVGMVSGASVYPFAWSILLAARAAGYGGTLTTMPIAEEPKLQTLLGLPEHVAVAAIIPLGRPLRTLTKLKRLPVSEIAMHERWGGPPLTS